MTTFNVNTHVVAERPEGHFYKVEVSRNCLSLLFDGEHIITATPDHDKWDMMVSLCEINNITVDLKEETGSVSDGGTLDDVIYDDVNERKVTINGVEWIVDLSGHFSSTDSPTIVRDAGRIASIIDADAEGVDDVIESALNRCTSIKSWVTCKNFDDRGVYSLKGTDLFPLLTAVTGNTMIHIYIMGIVSFHDLDDEAEMHYVYHLI